MAEKIEAFYCLMNRSQATGTNTKNIMNIVNALAPPGDMPSLDLAVFPSFAGLKQFRGNSEL